MTNGKGIESSGRKHVIIEPGKPLTESRGTSAKRTRENIVCE
ncbi:MAG: hypothetical protein OJF50_004886 [Nitrospira sp.]|nr:hypothetical protein [Nitrospira sp.]